MAEETLEIALFAEGETGLRLVGRLGDPDLVAAVRVRLAVRASGSPGAAGKFSEGACGRSGRRLRAAWGWRTRPSR